MRFFIDTAKVEDIRKANDMGVICGVTTNPSLIAKEGRVFEEVIAEIASIVDGPISGEVKATTVDAEGMIREGREIAKIHPNMVVKIPMTVEGLKACKALTAEGIKTNVTLVFTANQALLAARAGATYVSPFLGRLDDIRQRGVDLIREIADILLAVNRPYGKSDYIPCICWGRNARYASAFEVGGHVLIWGRIQSRDYMKKIGENETEKRTAYEISVSKLEYME